MHGNMNVKKEECRLVTAAAKEQKYCEGQNNKVGELKC